MLQITRQERLALQVTALLLAAGGGVRLVALNGADAQWEKTVSSADTTTRVAGNLAPEFEELRARSAVQAAREDVQSKPLAAGEKLDPNSANVDELQRLPRVGPALAGRILDWRGEHGRFRTLADLDEVPGVGPSMLSALAPHLTLAAPSAASSRARDEPVDLNRATADELGALPGVGPVLSARIVAWREANGPFRSLDDLDEVSGIGPAMRARLEPLVSIRP